VPASPPAAKPGRRRRRRRHLRALSILRLLALLFLWGVSAGAGFAFLAVRTVMADLPKDLTRAFDYHPDRKSLVISADGEEIGAFFLENRRVVPLARMPPHVPAAFIAAEDARFWEHPGFDVFGIGRAAWKNFTTGGVKQGASTITQQVIKMLLLGNERTYERKLKEVVLAVRIERELSKPEILAIYLNHVFLGATAYGVAAAAEIYFGKDIEDVTIAEAALLAGLVAAPTEYAPHLHYKLARERQRYVLGRMREDGYVNDTQLAFALDEPIAIIGAQPLNDLAAPYFVEQVRRQAQDELGFHRLFHDGVRLYSTLDSRMQLAAEVALRHGLDALDRRLGFHGPIGSVPRGEQDAWARGPARPYHTIPADDPLAPPTPDGGDRLLPAITYQAMIVDLPRRGGILVDTGPETLPLADADAQPLRAWRKPPPKKPGQPRGRPGPPLAVGDLLPVRLSDDGRRVVLAQPPWLQGALVAIEPSTGRIRALVGGYDWRSSRFDRASQARRQVGSSIKPFIYGTALAAGITEVDRFLDGPISVPTATGRWSPSNYDNKFSGWVTLRTAIARSLNTISVQLTMAVSLDRVIETLRGFGVTSPIPRHISVALGTPDLTPLELAGGYAGIAAGGRRVTPRFVDLIVDADGKVLVDRRADPPGPVVFTAATAYALQDLMKGVVERGTAKRAQELGRPTAGKTGTSANFKDVWFVGFTPDLLCGVWIGRDDSTPIGDRITGGGAAVPIWVEFMKAAHPPTPPRDFPVPPGITFARAQEGSGQPMGSSPSAAWVPFVRGTLPARFTRAAALPTFSARVAAPPLP
jgi:penicillin-binding protein 1A